MGFGKRIIGGVTVAGLAVSVLVGLNSAQAAKAPDPTDPSSLFSKVKDPDIRMYLQTTARLDGEDTVFRISGSMMSNVPGDQYAPKFKHGQQLFGFEGYNIRQWWRKPDTKDIYMLSRELVFYTDLKTGEVVNSWTNPLDGKTHKIVPVANDHVNQTHLREVDGKLFYVFGTAAAEQLVPFSVPKAQEMLGRKSWTANIAPQYSLAERYGIQEDFGLVDSTYAAWELFNTSVQMDDVKPWRKTSKIRHDAMPTMINWSRTGPTLPWMCMPEKKIDAHLLYSARSWSMSSFKELDPWIKSRVKSSYPLYANAPDQLDTTPNATTWTAFFYDEMQGKGKNGKDLTWKQWCKIPASNTP